MHSGAAQTGDASPSRLIGTWASAESLYAGDTGQSELYLESDGFGIMVGSTKPAMLVDGSASTHPGPRAIIGFPIRASLDGDAITLVPTILDKKNGNGPAFGIACRYEEDVPALVCATPEGLLTLKRRSENLSAEVVQTITQLRASLPALSK